MTNLNIMKMLGDNQNEMANLKAQLNHLISTWSNRTSPDAATWANQLELLQRTTQIQRDSQETKTALPSIHNKLNNMSVAFTRMYGQLKEQLSQLTKSMEKVSEDVLEDTRQILDLTSYLRPSDAPSRRRRSRDWR